MRHKCTLFETLSQYLGTSAPHNSQIYHKSTPECDARDVRIISLSETHHKNPAHSEDFWSHIDPCTTQPYTEDYPISLPEDYRLENIQDGACW